VRTAGGVRQAHVAHRSPKDLTVEPAPATLAFDWNLTDLAVGTDGFRLPNLRRGKPAEKKRKRMARAVARSKKGSKRRHKTVVRLARAYETEANARRTARHTGAARLMRHAVGAGHKGIAVEIADWAGLLTRFALPKDRDASVEAWNTATARNRPSGGVRRGNIALDSRKGMSSESLPFWRRRPSSHHQNGARFTRLEEAPPVV